jgi:putative acetyltransferase
MIIRSEKVQDYAVIADINVRAFEERMGEALIVALSRQRSAFDPDLSLVAEEEGRVIGHALFTPMSIRLSGETLRVVNLGPIAVDPDVQRKGIGGALIARGHELARAKGYALCFLLGHPTYYPRLGYLTHAFGASSCKLHTHDLPESDLDTRKPTASDLPALRDLWLREEGDVDFSVDPGDQLHDWCSPNPAITARVYLQNAQVVGYTRIHRDEQQSPGVFFARDHETARKMARLIGGGLRIELPLHPLSASAGAFADAHFDTKSWEASMVYPLLPSAFDAYYQAVQAGTRPPGRPIWTVPFEIA